jgi:hypothetical protein
MIWVCGHRSIEGNEISNQLSKLGSERPFIGPEPTCVTSAGGAKKVIRDSTETTLEPLTGLEHAKVSSKDPLSEELGNY